MLKSIEFENFGPYKGTHKLLLDPTGKTVVSGRSQSGKSTIVAGLTFVLWGEDPHGGKVGTHLIHHGAKKCSVTLEWAHGVKHRRTMSSSRNFIRERIQGREVLKFTSEKDWRGRLGALERKREIIRHLFSPMAWVALAGLPGGGRNLRDLIGSLVPNSSKAVIVRMMAERDVPLKDGSDHATWSESDATKTRANYSRAVSHAQGVAQTAHESVDRLSEPSPAKASAPTTDALQEARDTLALEKTWDEHRDETGKWEGLRRDHQRQAQNRKDYERRYADLGENPGPCQTNVRTAKSDSNKAGRRATKAAHEVSDLRAELKAITPKTVELPEGVKWEGDRLLIKTGAMLSVDNDGVLFTVLEENQTDALCPWEAIHELVRWHDQHSIADRLGDLKARLAKAEEAFEAAERVAVLAAETHEKSQKHTEAHNSWVMASRALGTKPTLKDLPEAPTPLERPHANSEQLARAQVVIDADRDASAVETDRAGLLEGAEATAATAEQDLKDAKATAAYWSALVDCIREAPAEAVRSVIPAMGDLGPVELIIGNDPACIVLVDGVPWSSTSSGRRVVADAYLREGFRRAAGLGKLPLIIDDIVTIGGQPPATVPNPKITLVTTDDPEGGVTTFVNREG